MKALAGLLSERLSKAQVLDGFDTQPWAVCGQLPQAVAFPESQEQVAEILWLSSQEGWRCVPGGRGSWLNGGQPPQGVDLLISSERMTGISAYEPADLFIEAQAGAEWRYWSAISVNVDSGLPSIPPVESEVRSEPWWPSGSLDHSRRASGPPGIRCSEPRS